LFAGPRGNYGNQARRGKEKYSFWENIVLAVGLCKREGGGAAFSTEITIRSKHIKN